MSGWHYLHNRTFQTDTLKVRYRLKSLLLVHKSSVLCKWSRALSKLKPHFSQDCSTVFLSSVSSAMTLDLPLIFGASSASTTFFTLLKPVNSLCLWLHHAVASSPTCMSQTIFLLPSLQLVESFPCQSIAGLWVCSFTWIIHHWSLK